MATLAPAIPESTKWQDLLQDHCQSSALAEPSYQILSDRRGGRTAWSAIVTVDGMGACSARHWYDGTYLNNAKEDAAEVALLKMGVDTVPS